MKIIVEHQMKDETRKQVKDQMQDQLQFLGKWKLKLKVELNPRTINKSSSTS